MVLTTKTDGNYNKCECILLLECISYPAGPVFVLVFSNLNLVLTEDKVAIENTVAPKDNSKAQETNDFLNDQLAESSQSVTKALGNIVVSDNLKETHHEPQHHVQLPEEVTGIGRAIQLTDSSRNGAVALNSIQVSQQNLHQGYVQPQQAQQVYLQYPTQQVRIFGAEASPLQQTDSEGPQALGYTSYIEHLSEKDEEELKTALKHGSVSDIKRLVPKSGISFKIYKGDKNSQSQSNPPTHFGGKTPPELSVLHHRVKGELPVASPIAQAEVYQVDPQPSLLIKDNGEEHRNYEYAQQLLQSPVQDQQGLNAHAVYYAQPETQKTLPSPEKSSSITKQHFRINVAESNYNKQTTAAELHGNLKSPSKSSKKSQKQWNSNGQTGGIPKANRPAKTLEALHYAVDPLQNEDSKSLPQIQGSVGQNFNSHKAENSFVETAKHDSASYLPDSYVTKTSQNNFAGHFANFAHSDQKVAVNLLSENQLHAEGIKPGNVIGHLPTAAYKDDAFKSNHFAVTDSETAKSGQHNLLSSIQKSSYVDTKSSHNFDHQKALEGSTPFDIKNAIDGSGSLIHQTNHLGPTITDIHHLEQPRERPFTYVISKIPASTVVIDNSTPDAVVEGHQIKDFEHGGLRTPAQFSYHPTAEVPAKFYLSPQTFLWSSEHFKQGNALASKDLHHQLLRLHLPKEEIYVKTPNMEFPVSVVSQVSLSQQKKPLAFHYDYPFMKTFPQELHFQAKTKTRVQPNPVGHLKPGQPVAIDWSLFKSGSPNHGINTLGIRPELMSHIQESGKKKIVPILVRKRKNRSNTKHEIGIVYGKVNANLRPKKPNHRQEKNVRGNLLTETGNNLWQLEAKDERKNEFSVSASYKVDRSSKSS